MARGDGDDGGIGSHGGGVDDDNDDDGGGVDSAHAGMIFFRSRGSRPWLGEALRRAAPALRWATLGWAALLAVLQLQQAGVASALGSGLAPPTPEQVAFRASARRAVSERQADENGTGTLGCPHDHSRPPHLNPAEGKRRGCHVRNRRPALLWHGALESRRVHGGCEKGTPCVAAAGPRLGRRRVVAHSSALGCVGKQGGRETGSQVGGKRQTADWNQQQ
ncbi:hypothetical protein COCVIDRAFT_18550 [Bipolaris victoriae FI3]|uniref:Uncharacterized protein n=1 Tax=Bipolaris victoriae (strain FI3) TaxID=930091 RepID=W7E0R4_BIPV3|nr:hypothetical protein COCVIDRAFT_18550 [Bipolaris victoriae FI3]